MERLSGLDATFLYFETPTNHMHVGAVMIFDPASMAGGYSFEKVKEFIGSRLHLVAQFRRRLAPVPFNLHHPVWFEDPTFDLDYHVRRVAVPAPGGPEELGDLAGDILGRPLDRNRPLWELWVVEGLEGGLGAVVAKMHHSTVDGVSGANLMVHLFDLAPEATEVEAPPPDRVVEHKPSDLELVGYAMVSRLRRPLALAKVMPRVARGLTNVVRLRRRPGRAAGGTPLTAPRCSFNASLSPHRKVAFTSVPLGDIKAIKKAFGCTVNDVVLAITAGALRRFLLGGDELPDKPLVATCPVSVHPPDGHDDGDDDGRAGANRVSAMFVSLPVHLDDPVARLEAIRETTAGAKEEHNAVGAELLMEFGELAAPNTFAAAARLYSRSKLADRHPVVHNLVVSNVPGPPFPLYFAGARLVALHPLGPIFDGAGINLTVLSYLDDVGFGFLADRELVPRLWELANAVADATAELRKAAAKRTG